MKKIFLFIVVFVLLCISAKSQSVVNLRGDTIKIWKNGGTAELVLKNASAANVGAFLKNSGNGVTAFGYAVDTIYKINDSSLVACRGDGCDTLIVGGSPPVISDSAWSLTGNNISYGKYIGTNNDFDLRFFTNGLERIRVDSASGEVLINTTSDAGDYKLQVNGNVYATKFDLSGGGGVRTNGGTELYSFGNTQVLGSSGVYISTAGIVQGIKLAGSEITFNELGSDVDVRIEGDTDPNLLFTDASADEVRIGTASDLGTSKLQVLGGIVGTEGFITGDNGTGNRMIFDATPNGGLRVSRSYYAANGLAAFRHTNQFSAVANVDSAMFTIDMNGKAGNVPLLSNGWITQANALQIKATTSKDTAATKNTGLYSSNGLDVYSEQQFKTTTGAVSSAYGVKANVLNHDNGSTTSSGAFAFYADAASAVTGKAYAFYANTGYSFFNDRVGIKTASPDSTLHVVGGFKLVNGTQGSNKVLTSDANGGASWQTPLAGLLLDEGSYTPTISNVTNIGSSTAYTTNWFRVGDRIYVFGEIEIDVTSAGTPSELRITLPVGSTLSNTYSLAGTAVHEDGTPIRISADTGTSEASFKFTPNTATANKYSFHFSYLYVAP